MGVVVRGAVDSISETYHPKSCRILLLLLLLLFHLCVINLLFYGSEYVTSTLTLGQSKLHQSLARACSLCSAACLHTEGPDTVLDTSERLPALLHSGLSATPTQPHQKVCLPARTPKVNSVRINDRCNTAGHVHVLRTAHEHGICQAPIHRAVLGHINTVSWIVNQPFYVQILLQVLPVMPRGKQSGKRKQSVDKLSTARFLRGYIRRKCMQQHQPYENGSTDESMIRNRGQSTFRQL